ncbi:MAG TPA: GNAT family protein, partial [Trueperaceae bacterium]
LGYAFDTLHLERVRLSTFADNLRAQAAFKKAGFVELRRARSPHGRIDVHMEQTGEAWYERLAEAQEGEEPPARVRLGL